jgi:hypothetical protein
LCGAAGRRSRSRVDKMLCRVGTLEKLVMQPTSGLEFLVKAGRLDLAAETIAVDERFVPIVPLHVRQCSTFGRRTSPSRPARADVRPIPGGSGRSDRVIAPGHNQASRRRAPAREHARAS